MPSDQQLKRYSVSIITQGQHRFFSCTIPSDVLAKCCFVTTREDDPQQGFQRMLDKKRAQDIANYIDEGLGTIPSSIILSAQREAELVIVGQGKTLQFKAHPKAFLVLDGQHRVYGFSLAKSNLRVPVVIYSGLTRRDETRLFIDINSKQKGVPSELLFDIKKLAEYESSTEERLREVYDLFQFRPESALLGLTSPASKSSGKISRSTFNAAAKPLLDVFEGRSAAEFYEFLNCYLIAFKTGLGEIDAEQFFTQNIVFRAIMTFFPTAAAKVQDRHGSQYSVDNFADSMSPLFETIKPSRFANPGNSIKALAEVFSSALKTKFRL
jgi:DGQHR domain-containing protein